MYKIELAGKQFSVTGIELKALRAKGVKVEFVL